MSSIKLSSLLTFIIFISCGEDPILHCSDTSVVVSEYTNSNGDKIQIFEDGKAYSASDNCSLVADIFDPDFYEKSYEETEGEILIIVDEDTRYPVKKSFSIDFENINDWRDLLLTKDLERDRIITNITLQSPSAPTVESYSNLSRCLISNDCDFIDNRIDLVADPKDIENKVLRFHALSPTEDMVTSKCSISGSTLFFKKGDDFWFQARYYIEKGRPLTIADFESEYFLGYMGPRLIFRGSTLNVENKFAEKLTFSQSEESALELPLGKWVTIKVHLKYDEIDGVIQVWQDGQSIIDTRGKNMPFSFWIHNRLEIGISATQQETTLLIDDIQFGPTDFN